MSPHWPDGSRPARWAQTRRLEPILHLPQWALGSSSCCLVDDLVCPEAKIVFDRERPSTRRDVCGEISPISAKTIAMGPDGDQGRDPLRWPNVSVLYCCLTLDKCISPWPKFTPGRLIKMARVNWMVRSLGCRNSASIALMTCPHNGLCRGRSVNEYDAEWATSIASKA